MPPLLSVRDLCKGFTIGSGARSRTIRALDNVSLDVHAGETLGLVGESGCGKSTLARCALRLLEPDSGIVRFDGAELTAMKPEELRVRRREFQMIFQDPFASLNPRMNVLQILCEPYEIQGIGDRRFRESRALELMESVQLDVTMKDRLPSHLSGGQQQRVVIARALASGPRLIVADEPVSALDASVQAQILNLLVHLQEQYGLTLLLISHSLPVVRHLCSRVAVMYLGRVVEEAPAELFFGGPKHPYSRALLESTLLIGLTNPEESDTGRGDIASAVSPPSGCHFHPRCPEVLSRCREESPRLQDCSANWKVACHLHSNEA